MARKLQPVVPWQGFAPDADPTTPGVLTACTMVMANDRGIEAFPRPAVATTQTGAPPFEVNRAKLGFVLRQFPVLTISSSDRLYMASLTGGVVGNWTDSTRTAPYTGGNPWDFETFGDFILAVTGSTNVLGSTPMQQCNAIGLRFTDVAGAPAASIICCAQGFVLVFCFYDAATLYGAIDGWWCSTRYDHTNWTLAPGGSTRGRLVDSLGAVRAAIEFGGSVYAFKEGAIYRGDYSPGSTEVWVWNKLPFNTGTSWRYGVCKDDSRIYFVGQDDVYAFDGVNLVPLMRGKIRRWFETYRPKAQAAPQSSIQLTIDRSRSTLIVQYGGAILTYHIPTGRWGVGDSIYSAVCETPPNHMSTNSFYGFRFSDRKAYDMAGMFSYLVGAPNPSFTTGDLGDDRESIETCEFRPRFTYAPQAGVFARVWPRETLDAGSVPTANFSRSDDGKIEVDVNARWCRIETNVSGHFESIGYVADHTSQGAT